MEHRRSHPSEHGPALWEESTGAGGPSPARGRPEHQLFAPSSSAAPEEEEGNEEEVPGGLALLAHADSAFLAMSRCLRTPGHLGGCGCPATPARGAFSYWVGGSRLALQRQVLHDLLQQQHCLRVARHYCKCLKAASGFVRRLMEAEHCLAASTVGQSAEGSHLLRGLCQELRAHTSRWGCLQRHLHKDPWLRPLMLWQPEVVQCMRQALCLLNLQALCLLERCLEGRLWHGTREGPPLPSEAIQGLEMYNQALSEGDLRGAKLEPGIAGLQEVQAFSVERVLAVLAAERGRLAGKRLSLLLPWQPARAGDLGPTAAAASGAGRGLPAHLQALCREEEQALTALLPELLISAGGLGHRLLHRLKLDQPLSPQDAAWSLAPNPLLSWKSSDWPEASSIEAAVMLCAEYWPLFWRAASTTWVHQLELQAHKARFQRKAGASLGQWLTDTLAEACLPVEAAEELREAALGLLGRETLWQWDQGFCHALGTSRVDRCLPKPTTVACSQTGQTLQSLLLLLAFSMRCLDIQPFHGSPGRCRVPASLLSLVVATCHAASYWTMSKAHQYLASWSLGQFLLVTQGDLQLLKTEAGKMLVLVSRTFLEDRWQQSASACCRERELGLQVQSAATSIQLFANDVLELFCLDCKRVSAEVFGQAMPDGKYWRLALQAEPPTAASEYAWAAAQAVLAPVLQGVRWLSRDSQVLVLGQVTTTFLEVWMEHILAQKIKFSLQGALQLRRDFGLVREALQAEDYALPAEVKQLLSSLRVFHQADNAIACLLQQPSKGALASRSWDALQKCCSRDGMRSWHSGPGSLSNLEHLEGLSVHPRAGPENWAADLLSRAPGGGSSSETYLSLAQQEWLALRLHGTRRWRMPALSCMSHPSEP